MGGRCSGLSRMSDLVLGPQRDHSHQPVAHRLDSDLRRRAAGHDRRDGAEHAAPNGVRHFEPELQRIAKQMVGAGHHRARTGFLSQEADGINTAAGLALRLEPAGSLEETWAREPQGRDRSPAVPE